MIDHAEGCAVVTTGCNCRTDIPTIQHLAWFRGYDAALAGEWPTDNPYPWPPQKESTDA